MRLLTRVVAIVVALAAAYYAYRWYFPDDEAVIRARLDDLAATVSHTGGGEGFSTITRAAKFGTFFTRDVVIEIGGGFAPIRGRDMVLALAAKAQVPGEGFTIRFVDVTVTVDPSGLSALATMTATAQGRSLGDLQAIDARELEMAFLKVEGEWQIERVTGVETIQRPR
jgi:hypothetical protein